MDAPAHPAEAGSPERSARQNPIARISEDGLLAGVTGAVVVAAFFFVVDLARGQPFYTPSLLGSVLFRGAEVGQVAGVDAAMVAAYTGVHVLSFVVLGTLAAFLVHEMERHPPVAVIAILLAVCFEGGFFAVSAAAMPGIVGTLGAALVAVANLLALASMAAVLLWWRHPDAVRQLDHVWDDA